ncbi:hypothetical protein NCS57_01374600 [Fusarium keratoplasticum]|uniref:Uncharacterized protein n=1 Tax=Fusarium keratoplasticum TaxID=1328300 RepID=A0ACC0QDH8_9HYPO|nr:hypothetical protein NCS57_01374600 [Fusarium keratoplasticum]KAI8650410.1 hypothetical protein NCS57_01374600 [Fusarium keratoplasticum]
MTTSESTQFLRRIDILEEPSEEQIQNLLEIETSDHAETPQPQNEQYGLFHLNSSASQPPNSPQDACKLDIVAVHGLGGDAYRTWQHENGFNWLQHLEEEFTGIRVYSYGYDSGVAFSGGTASLTDYARHLLSLVKMTRSSEKEEDRKIVFVCHSLGGLLVKQAFLLASNERGLFGSLRQSTYAILFFATPQTGTRSEYYDDILCNIVDAMAFANTNDRLLEGFRKAIHESIRSNGSRLCQLAKKFHSEAYHLQHVSSFVETSPIPGHKDILVGKVSGQRGLSKERVIPMLQHDHRQICKFSSLESKGMNIIISQLRDIADSLEFDLAEAMIALEVVRPQDELALRHSTDRLSNDALLQAASTGNLVVAKRLIKNGADINATNHYGQTALHLAVSGNDREMTRTILDKGGDPNVQDYDGRTPLHRAAETCDEETVKLLLDRKADCAIRNRWNEAPVRVARRAHRLAIMKMLQETQNVRQDLQERINVVMEGNSSRNRQVIRSYAESAYEHAHIVINMDMDTAVQKNASQFSQTARKGNLDLVEDLIDIGVEPTPDALYLAAKEGHSDVVEVLADVMEDIDADVGWAGNALCTAACNLQGLNTIRVLLEKGADVNWQGGAYGCALQAATANYRLENVKLLLKHGADVNAQCGHYGNSLTAVARHHTHFTEMATLLLERGADIDAQGPGVYGNPLQTAVWMAHVQNVRFLMRNGASVTVQGRFGSALEIAQRRAFRFTPNPKDEEDILAMLTEDKFVGYISYN